MRTINIITSDEKEHFEPEIGKTVNCPPKSINIIKNVYSRKSDKVDKDGKDGKVEDLIELESTFGSTHRKAHSNIINIINIIIFLPIRNIDKLEG